MVNEHKQYLLGQQNYPMQNQMKLDFLTTESVQDLRKFRLTIV